ncbi:AI-2E family transporter [Lutimaribacter sp. EGI FJ00015]|uniref:AI-2E family transporter n=1 Tax=Lutimaribacter degradans TaxID=2945989 RepID=A0ACC5ZTI8_9RHOB|nr:AI-2E family transporter [Lutimaribacter sp. EGI FJ00013]MCM2561626.1 AI-2E family transporter [Lutimaribacter sp. EGI FJ00013]MCO0612663.1 AI-2E family transporter [Lutimaribacter sp. EGI FJ00015]MCO0635321.1 AI-2E family transporter [Lutimaribacter sp. EGI FJ00014]
MYEVRLQPVPATGRISRLDRGAIQTVSLGIIASVMIIAALDAASLIAVPTVLAVLCAIALAPSVRWLERTGAPASLCAAFVVGGLLSGAAVTAYSLSPSAEALNDRAPQILREAEWRARQIISELSYSSSSDDEAAPAPAVVPENNFQTAPDDAPATDSQEETGDDTGDNGAKEQDDDAVDRLVEGGQRMLTDWAIGTPRIAGGAAFWAMLTFYMLRDRVMLARWVISVVPGGSARRAVGRAMRDVRTNVARYLLAMSAVNLALGICIAVAFQLLGVANAPLWGVAAALLNFMPFLGIAILALITLGIGIASFEDPVVAFAPFAVIVVLNILEGQIVTPMVIGARIRIAPIAVFVAIAFGAWLWGAGGALVATPALIVAVAFVRRLNAASLSADRNSPE